VSALYCIPRLGDTVDAVQKWDSVLKCKFKYEVRHFRRLLFVMFQLLRTDATCLLNT